MSFLFFPHAYSLAGGKDHTQSQCLLRQFACICPLFNVSGHLSFRIISVTAVALNTVLPQIPSIQVMKEWLLQSKEEAQRKEIVFQKKRSI